MVGVRGDHREGDYWVGTPEGCQNFRCSDLLSCDLYRDLLNAAGVEFDENYLFCGLAPLWGAVMTNDFSGGLRGLRPPATFLQPSGLRWETNNWRSGLTPVFLYHLISWSHFRGAPQ